MIGLVFLGTFYYLESGWKTFEFFQTDMEKLSINYAKIIIAYFSATLVLSLSQNPFFPPTLSTIGLLIVSIGVIVSTISLNKQLDSFQVMTNNVTYLWNKWFNWVWFSVVFILPLALVHWNRTLSIPTTTDLIIGGPTIGWIVFGSLIFGYWNLILFLLTPFQVHKLERDKPWKENKEEALQGKSPSNNTWSEDRIDLAEERIKSNLKENNITHSPDFEIDETYKTDAEISGDLATPRLFLQPSVDGNGEASIDILLPDDWMSDKDLLDRSSIVAHYTGLIARNAYRDLTGIVVRVHRWYLVPWDDSRSRIMLLKIRWRGLHLNSLTAIETDPETILESSAEYLLNPILYPMGLREYDFDPADKEPKNGEDYSIYAVEDQSTAVAKRYQVKVVLRDDLSKDQIRQLIPDLLQEIRKIDFYRSNNMEEKWKGKKADVIWLFMFDEARGPSEMIGIDLLDHYIGKAEWYDSALDSRFTPSEMSDPDDTINGIRIKWS